MGKLSTFKSYVKVQGEMGMNEDYGRKNVGKQTKNKAKTNEITKFKRFKKCCIPSYFGDWRLM